MIPIFNLNILFDNYQIIGLKNSNKWNSNGDVDEKEMTCETFFITSNESTELLVARNNAIFIKFRYFH